MFYFLINGTPVFKITYKLKNKNMYIVSFFFILIPRI